jgi:hypothetical protein
MPRNWENPMPRTITARRGLPAAFAYTVVLVALAVAFATPAARAAETTSKASPDTTVRITAVPPAIHVEASTEKDAGSEDTGTSSTKRGRARVTIDADDEDFDAFGKQVHKMPWIIGLIFLVVGSIFLTPVVLLVGIIWYKLRKTRLQNEAMLRLAERGVVPPAQAASALATGASPETVAPQVYQEAVALRKRVLWSDLRKGIILTMIGAAFCLYWIIAGGEASWVGLILLFIGAGYLALWWLEGRHLGSADAGRVGPGSGVGDTGAQRSSGP